MCIASALHRSEGNLLVCKPGLVIQVAFVCIHSKDILSRHKMKKRTQKTSVGVSRLGKTDAFSILVSAVVIAKRRLYQFAALFPGK